MTRRAWVGSGAAVGAVLFLLLTVHHSPTSGLDRLLSAVGFVVLVMWIVVLLYDALTK